VLNTLKEWKLACPPGELVFPAPRDGGVMSHATLYKRAFGRAQRTAGVVRPMLDDAGEQVTRLARRTKERVAVTIPKYGPHDFRHFCASWWIEQGFNPKRVMGIMGHASIQMTFDVYGHLFPAGEEDHERLAAGQIGLVG
jgi:integrase